MNESIEGLERTIDWLSTQTSRPDDFWKGRDYKGYAKQIEESPRTKRMNELEVKQEYLNGLRAIYLMAGKFIEDERVCIPKLDYLFKKANSDPASQNDIGSIINETEIRSATRKEIEAKLQEFIEVSILRSF